MHRNTESNTVLTLCPLYVGVQGYSIFLFLPFPILLPLPMLGGPAGHLCHPRHHPGHPPLELCGEHPEEDGQKEHTYKPLGKATNSPG